MFLKEFFLFFHVDLGQNSTRGWKQLKHEEVGEARPLLRLHIFDMSQKSLAWIMG